LTDQELDTDYELATGKVIVESHPDHRGVPAVLVANHGPFTWGSDPIVATENAAVLEETAAMALFCQGAEPAPRALLDKHWYRKHGPGATYGQKGKK
jgi:L-ribulose-5-phosphate 4-epimerase